MKLSNFDHASWVCNWHNQEQQGNYNFGPSRRWAQDFLICLVKDETLTPDQANDIRRACGWDVVPVQMTLFVQEPAT